MKRILSIALCIIFVLSLAACGEGEVKERTPSATQGSPIVDNTASDAPDETQSQNGSSSEKPYATLEEYLATPANQEGINKSKEVAQGVMEIDVYADNGCLVYDYRYTFTLDDAAVSTAAATLDASLDATESTFVSLARAMQSQIEEDVYITVIYRNGDGTIITQRSLYP